MISWCQLWIVECGRDFDWYREWMCGKGYRGVSVCIIVSRIASLGCRRQRNGWSGNFEMRRKMDRGYVE